MADFNHQLRLRMQRYRMTHEDAARYLGVSSDTVSGWLNGRQQPSAATLRLFYVLGEVMTLAPDLHRAIVERSRSNQPRKKRGPVKGSTYVRFKKSRTKRIPLEDRGPDYYRFHEPFSDL